ncbi:acyl-CoA dehydrogenase family protein [Chondromyces apiculatus]|uniref:Butyryl-CoA dehydrogenase n=1 Tax=Chondromyces apiculatus DSM 436 TaxID=1192034 RepID=A0A017T9B7_9BACT|nr:acyl-CoA dehydrogenase family protein [Chondromyces apiculatus]EYF05196.1 Butyryl-CoA dehydrogenase [Chondromyces apiculatus DSM 436]
MDFALTADQQRARDAARGLAERALAPLAAELDRTDRYPAEIIGLLAGEGLLAPTAPRTEGGAELDAVGFALVVEELSRACASAGAIVRAHGALFVEPLLRFGAPALRGELLAEAAAGRALGAFAAFASGGAPDGLGAGGAPEVTATRSTDGGYRLDGIAHQVLLVPGASQAIVLAASGGDAGHTTALVVQEGPGVTVEPGATRLGMRAVPVGTLRFEGVAVPASRVLGEEGGGARVAAVARDLSRIGVAAQALGIARAACEEALAFAKAPLGGRVGAGTPAEHQGVQFLVADMTTEIDAARLLTLRAAALRDRGAPCAAEAAAAKLYAADMASRVAQRAMQILGAAGWTAGSGPDRHARDARITEIDEGTAEEQRRIVAGGML